MNDLQELLSNVDKIVSDLEVIVKEFEENASKHKVFKDDYGRFFIDTRDIIENEHRKPNKKYLEFPIEVEAGLRLFRKEYLIDSTMPYLEHSLSKLVDILKNLLLSTESNSKREEIHNTITSKLRHIGKKEIFQKNEFLLVRLRAFYSTSIKVFKEGNKNHLRWKNSIRKRKAKNAFKLLQTAVDFEELGWDADDFFQFFHGERNQYQKFILKKKVSKSAVLFLAFTDALLKPHSSSDICNLLLSWKGDTYIKPETLAGYKSRDIDYYRNSIAQFK